MIRYGIRWGQGNRQTVPVSDGFRFSLFCKIQIKILKLVNVPSLMALSRSDLTSSLGFSGMMVFRSWGGPDEMLFRTAFIGEFCNNGQNGGQSGQYGKDSLLDSGKYGYIRYHYGRIRGYRCKIWPILLNFTVSKLILTTTFWLMVTNVFGIWF
jgi:hypothetical protein